MVGLNSTAPALAFPGLSIIEIKTTGVRVRKWIVVARSRQRVLAVLTIRLSGVLRIGIRRVRRDNGIAGERWMSGLRMLTGLKFLSEMVGYVISEEMIYLKSTSL